MYDRFHFNAGPFAPSFDIPVAEGDAAVEFLVSVQDWEPLTAEAALLRLALGVTESIESRGLTITHIRED